MWFEMHKHTQYSMFDGFDKVKNIVRYAKELGMKAIGISDHGNACGVAQLYMACQKEGLKPLMGCEVYFQPTFDSSRERFHLCLYAMNETGYRNMCRILTEANDKNFYRYGHVTFELLERYSEGLICSSACIGGFIPQMIDKGKKELVYKATDRFVEIFGDNFYFEIQPIKIDNKGTQERVNKILMKIGEECGVKCIMTTDSHFTSKDDFESYLMMHKMSKIGQEKGEGFTLEHIEETYKERYMHSEEDITTKFKKMHGFYPEELLHNMDEIYDKIDIKLDFADSIPTFDDVEDTYQEMKDICISRLKETNRYNKEYIDRLKYEMSVIKGHELCDYFLIVRDYVKFARDNDIYVGPGRGSVGGSLVAELMGITSIDAIKVGTDFDRFLRPDKKKMPDVDLDFESSGQDAVINYILNKYKYRSSKIVTFGYYKGANLINDLCKVYDIPSHEATRIKMLLQPLTKTDEGKEMAHFDFEDIDYEEAIKDRNIRALDKEYPDIVKHFCKLCGQAKYYGQHPAGVLVTKGEIGQYVPMLKVKGQLICSYDKYDVEALDMLKFDVLALRTMDVIHAIERETGDKFDRRNIPKDVEEEMYERFRTGNTLGIFQLNKEAAQNILVEIGADNIQDVIAAISCNRPGTLKLGMHKQYGANKQNLDEDTAWYPYTKDAYGSIIYQEHVMRICKGMAKMEPGDVDKLMKFKFSEAERVVLKEKFVKGAEEHSGIKKPVAEELFDNMALYMFNKGHGAGYALISEWQMYHKVKHPTEFWFSTMKHEIDERKKIEFMSEAARDGIVFFLPHVNYTADYSIRKVDGEPVIQIGYSIVKNVGEKAAQAIEEERRKNGIFRSYDDFYDRCKSRSVTSRVIESLQEEGALEFDRKTYIKRVTKYNSTLYMKGLRAGGKN
ncbi:MAG: DNA polymerase III subunit alpha [Clostridia bacterium]|nr:DNA polymerase III subunit alpha [Clostridia bacterium]